MQRTEAYAVHTACVNIPIVHVLVIGKQLHKPARLHARRHTCTGTRGERTTKGEDTGALERVVCEGVSESSKGCVVIEGTLTEDHGKRQRAGDLVNLNAGWSICYQASILLLWVTKEGCCCTTQTMTSVKLN